MSSEVPRKRFFVLPPPLFFPRSPSPLARVDHWLPHVRLQGGGWVHLFVPCSAESERFLCIFIPSHHHRGQMPDTNEERVRDIYFSTSEL